MSKPAMPIILSQPGVVFVGEGCFSVGSLAVLLAFARSWPFDACSASSAELPFSAVVLPELPAELDNDAP